MKQGGKPVNRVTPVVVANIMIFMVILVTGGLLSLFLPKQKISENEKRELTPLPQFKLINLFVGNYTDSLDLNYADNFPFRDDFVEFSGLVKETFGYRANDVRIYTQAAPVENVADPDSTVTLMPDTVVSIKKPDSPPKAKEYLNSILIHEGMAFQLFRGSNARAIAFAEMINAYRKALNDSIRIFGLVAPTPIDFYLPMELKTVNNLEGPNIQVVYDHLDSGVQAVDAYSEIESHANEYLFFNTDHHWTGRGAYYAYRAFCQRAGFTPVELNACRLRVRNGYLGSLYHITTDVRLKSNRDSVESFQVPMETTTYRYATPDLQNPVISRLLSGSPNYATFLGGDFPLIRIETENHNSKRILVIKDSFGNAMCPFLAMHYEEVFVVDYRYFEKNIISFIERNHITDFLFLHNTFVINSEFTVKKERYLMRIRDIPPLPVKMDSVMTDSVKIELKGDSIK